MNREPKIGIIIQARLGSTRFPEKVLKPFDNDTVLAFLIKRLRQIGLEVVVATTTSSKDDKLARYLAGRKINLYRGSEDNVLERYIFSAEEHGFTHVVRVCSDNPFISIAHLKTLINEAAKNPEVDYLSYAVNNMPAILTHYGIFSEVVKLNALEKLCKKYPSRKDYQEHVTLGIYSNPDQFKSKLIPAGKPIETFVGIRLTIDTQEDYQNIQELVQKHPQIYQADFATIAAVIMNEPTILATMKKSIIANKK